MSKELEQVLVTMEAPKLRLLLVYMKEHTPEVYREFVKLIPESDLRPRKVLGFTINSRKRNGRTYYRAERSLRIDGERKCLSVYLGQHVPNTDEVSRRIVLYLMGRPEDKFCKKVLEAVALDIVELQRDQ